MSSTIRRLSGAGIILLLLVVGSWGMGAQVSGAVGLDAAPGAAQGPRQERDGDPASPQISFIDSPTAACYRPAAGTDACYITWSYLSVTASPAQYIISMTITIDDRLVASHAGFFQSAMYVPGQVYGQGFRVPCGTAGAAGVPDLGRSYSYAIRARETGALQAANYGTVTCPAGVLRVFLPVVQRSFSTSP